MFLNVLLYVLEREKWCSSELKFCPKCVQVCIYWWYESCCICHYFSPLCPTGSWLADVSSCPKSRSSKSMISWSRNHRNQAAVASHRTLWDTITDERRYRNGVQLERIRRTMRDVSGQMQSLNLKSSPWHESYFEGMRTPWADLNHSSPRKQIQCGNFCLYYAVVCYASLKHWSTKFTLNWIDVMNILIWTWNCVIYSLIHCKLFKKCSTIFLNYSNNAVVGLYVYVALACYSISLTQDI